MYIRDYIQDFLYECEQAELEHKTKGDSILGMDAVQEMAQQDGVPEKKNIAIEGIEQLQKSQGIEEPKK